MQDRAAAEPDLVARTGWRRVNPAFSLDLVLIEPSRRPMASAAQAFLAKLEEESQG